MANAFLGSKKMLFRHFETVRYMTIEEAYLFRRKIAGPIEMLRDGKWVPIVIDRLEGTREVRTICADGLELVVGTDTSFVTTLGETHIKDFGEMTRLVLDMGKPRVTWEYKNWGYGYNTGFLVGLVLQYGMMFDDPYEGLKCRIPIRGDLIENAYRICCAGAKRFAKQDDTPYIYCENFCAQETIYIDDDTVCGEINSFISMRDVTRIDPNIILYGHRFCTGFIRGYFYNEDPLNIYSIPFQPELEIIQLIADMCGYVIDYKEDGHLEMRTKKKLTADVEYVSDPYEADEYLYSIRVKDALFPYFSIDKGIIVKG